MDLHHVFGKLFATENVEMEMLNRLTTVISYICNDSVSVVEVQCRSDVRDSFENLRYVLTVFCTNLVCRAYVDFRNYDAMYRSLRCDVMESIAIFILIYLT